MLIPSLMLGAASASAQDRLADTVYYNGKIYTMTETAEEAAKVENAHRA